MSTQTIYGVVIAALSAWAESAGFVISSEGVTLTDGRAPDRVCVLYVISDVDGGFASNTRHFTRYRVQVVLGVPPSSKPDLPGLLDCAEAAIIGAGGMPQGNRRMQDNQEAAKATISKDYLFVLGR